jgi:hypothetical protein
VKREATPRACADRRVGASLRVGPDGATFIIEKDGATVVLTPREARAIARCIVERLDS